MNTYGWDTVFVVNTTRINALLESQRDRTTLSFDTTLPDRPDSPLRGSFAPWKIASGGSNDIIHLQLDIESGTVRDGERSWDLSGATLIVSTYLHWLAVTAEEQDLRFDYNKLAPQGATPTPGELSVVSFRSADGTLPPDILALVSFALGKYLVDHASEVRFAFATVNLIPPETNSWLTPKRTAYGYFRREGGSDTFLAILSVTTDRDISSLQRTVDAAALPTDTNASFVISDELYLSNLIAPSLAKATNSEPGAFSFDTKQRVLRNRWRLWTHSVRVGLIDYDPYIDALEVRSVDDALRGRYSGGADLKAGISMTYTVDATNASSYRDGTLVFSPDPSPNSSSDYDIPWWFFGGGLIAIAIVEIVVKVISDELASQISNDNRERLALEKYPPTSILWGGSYAISVSNVLVRQSLAVFGNV